MVAVHVYRDAYFVCYFVNNRLHLVRVCLRCNFFYPPVNADKPNFVSFLVFVGAAASFTAKISSFETVAKQEAILNPVPK